MEGTKTRVISLTRRNGRIIHPVLDYVGTAPTCCRWFLPGCGSWMEFKNKAGRLFDQMITRGAKPPDQERPVRNF
jgi:hypothetical protein